MRQTVRRHLVATVGAASLLGLTLTASPAPRANAANLVAASSPSCNTIRFSSAGSWGTAITLDDGRSLVVEARSSRTVTVKAGGDHYFREATAYTDDPGRVRMVAVTPCASTPVRPKDGDEDRDGRADVLGIHGPTGNLYYYRMTSRGLASGTKAGTGWNNMVFMQRVNEIQGPGSRGALIAVHRNGSVWRYDNLGRGRIANGRQIGSGMQGYKSFAVTTTNTSYATGRHKIVATRDGWLYMADLTATSVGRMVRQTAYDPQSDRDLNEWGTRSRTVLALRNFNGVGDADLLDVDTTGNLWFHPVEASELQTFGAPRRVGTSWNHMGLVASPGSLDGDRLNDLVARRDDGNLYTYTNRGGAWKPAVKIGANWNAIRLLA